MKIQEILISKDLLIIETLLNTTANVIAKNIEIIRSETSDFKTHPQNVYGIEELNDLIILFSDFERMALEYFGDNSQTYKIVVQTLSYLKS